MNRALTFCLATALLAALLIPAPAFARSGKKRSGSSGDSVTDDTHRRGSSRKKGRSSGGRKRTSAPARAPLSGPRVSHSITRVSRES